MFAGGISLLSGSSVDIGNIAVPRPNDALSDRCRQAALRAMEYVPDSMTASERMQDPRRYARMQRERREHLESFIWVEANQAVLQKITDLICRICEENSWSGCGEYIDDPAHPAIDMQAAETGMLLAWLLRRHGAKLAECSPRISGLIQHELRRRLFAPVLAHDDYPFMQGKGSYPALILCDLLLSCIITETIPSRRQQPVKRIMHLLDHICAMPVPAEKTLPERLGDACALTDLARLLKRLTRGELDYTADVPPEAWLDDVLIPWIADEYFLDPCGAGLLPGVSGLDYFRLGYLTRDRALSALGAELHRLHEIPACGISGRILSMDYMRAIQDELSAPPRLKRAVSPDGGIMLSRNGGLTAAIVRGGNRRNAGDIVLFSGRMPILADFGGADLHSVPRIGGCEQLSRPEAPVQTEYNFSDTRDLMTADLSSAYPQASGLCAYQRTLMNMRGDQTVRLVDAFEFEMPPQEIVFRFICAQKPLSLRDSVRIGPVDMTWDGDMKPEIYETEAADGRCWLLQFILRDMPHRVICGFTFETN